tara:strand:+ start:38 stop:583 length:546 start_codon:yes stop_codon:yes gene_type:complete
MKKININTGTLLLSIPLIDDERFDKTIIIITESSKEEKIGFIINKKTNLKVIDLVKKIKIKSITTNYGGPVCAENLFYFHKNKSIEKSKKINNKLYFGGNFNQIIEYLNCKLIKSNEIFFCLGYCGWGNGQLEDEIKEKSWIVLNEQIDFISNVIDWKKKMIAFDEKYKPWVNSNRNFHLN